MKPLSKSQQAIFNFLKQCADEGRTPSVREICEATGLKSTSTVHHHLSALEEKGLIERSARESVRVCPVPGTYESILWQK